jgi:hypothetical protein
LLRKNCPQYCQNIIAKKNPVLDAVDKNSLTSIIVTRSNLSREKAAQTVDRWANTYQKAYTIVQSAKSKMEQTTKEAVNTATKGISKTAFITFIVLFFGLITAALGGYIGSLKSFPKSIY